MRNIIKTISLPIDGKPVDFRLTKLDAFSGAALMQLLVRIESDHPAPPACHPEHSEGSHPLSPEPFTGEQEDRSATMPAAVFTALSPADLRSLMTSCLNHVEVLLPAGYQPVMQGNSWSWPELEHDAAACLKLTLEEALWTLSGFFGGGGSISPPEIPASSPQPART